MSPYRSFPSAAAVSSPELPRADGTVSPEQRPEADINIEIPGAGLASIYDANASSWAARIQ
jgi:hypothetical protein